MADETFPGLRSFLDRLRRDGDLAIWTFTEIYRDLMSPDLRNFLLRQQVMMTATHMRDVVGADPRPLRAVFGLADIGTTEADEAAQTGAERPCRVRQRPTDRADQCAATRDAPPGSASPTCEGPRT